MEKRVLFITEDCNFNCVYCYEGEKSKKHMDNGLIKDVIIDLFSKANAKNLDRVSFSLFGGEPTLDFEKLHYIIGLSKKLANQYDITCNRSIVTNALLDSSDMDYLIDKFDNIFISLDGPFEINSLQRYSSNKQEDYKQIFSNAKQVYNQAPNKLQFKATITSKTIDKLEEIMKFFNSEFPLIPQLYQPCMVEKDNELYIDFNNYLEKFFLARSKNPLKKLVTTSLFKHVPSDVFCNLPYRRVVLPTGDVLGCHRLSIKDENDAVKDNFVIGKYQHGKLTIDKEKVNKLKKININKGLAEQCSDCFARFHCAGGCATIKLNQNLNPYQDPIHYCQGIKWFTVCMILEKLGIDFKPEFKDLAVIQEHNDKRMKELELDKAADFKYDLIERRKQ
ncbi:radical SAM/SPASM domain-containing protein [Fuchsiella alkaliacetigena]|uniref:radical SAM/SPASM domain-containing protein n=1 Tax=Fuchsiella alkaliacetigena TaxID=957042 RepID=UPI00200A29F6|nr:radical SAM protein [Fuchsiella alkaliacetigena]MCK8824023.1 4Fe-4S cluster-binding domain-containing protein [Fuchsiella alkaliacetigena]